MNRMLLPAATLILAACQDTSAPTPPTSTALLVASAASNLASEPRPGHYIVVFRDDVTNSSVLARSLVATHNGALEHTYRSAIKGFAGRLSNAAVASLRLHPDVAYVEPDGIVRAVATQTGATWGLDRLDQRDLPLSTTYSYAASGNGVNVYIIDTGIRTTHTEFGGRASSAFDAVGDGNGGTDCSGHGTHVAGTVAGATYGVAKQARLFAVRVLDCAGDGTTSGVIAGVDWVTANRVLPAVANMSLGGSASASLDQAVRNSIASGVTYALAAGNSSVSACNSSPARTAEAITVASTTTSDARSSFSKFGTCVDIFAPGSGITSAYNGNDGQTAVISGTSMASPHVAGAAALYLELNNSAPPSAVASALIANATTDKVTNAGTGSPNRLLYTGFIGAAPNAPPVARFTSSCVGLTCTLDARTSSDDAGIVSFAWDLGKFPDRYTTGSVVTATYPHEGSRTIVLTVTDGGGLSSITTQTITVGAPPPPPPPNQAPVAEFTSSCTNLNCNFNSTASSDDVGITSRSWTFGDGTTAGNVVSPSKTYSGAGTYSVTLTVTDGGGLSSSITKQVTVTAPPQNQPPVARFTWTCTGLTCTLDGRTSTDDNGIVSYNWDLGKFPDRFASGSVVTTTYPHSGQRTVTLVVTDAGGLTNSVTQVITLP
jgi:PKD repeat protein